MTIQEIAIVTEERLLELEDYLWAIQSNHYVRSKMEEIVKTKIEIKQCEQILDFLLGGTHDLEKLFREENIK